MGLSEISQTEMDSRDGPTHYVSIQHVYKPNNKSTKMKLAIKFSLKCPRTCLNMNKCSARVPKC